MNATIASIPFHYPTILEEVSLPAYSEVEMRELGAQTAYRDHAILTIDVGRIVQLTRSALLQAEIAFDWDKSF